MRLPCADLSSIGGGNANSIRYNAYPSVIGGGFDNLVEAESHNSTVSGGDSNSIQANANHCTIAGGLATMIQVGSDGSTISGGENNFASGFDVSIGGGNSDSGNGNYSTIAGGLSNIVQPAADLGTLSGGQSNSVSGLYATIGGGLQNRAEGKYGSVGGWTKNISSGEASTAPGGDRNTASGDYSFAVGVQNNASGDYSTAMGVGSQAIGDWSIAMGGGSTAGDDAAVALGYNAIASGAASIALGNIVTTSGLVSFAAGFNNTASGNYSAALGQAARAGTAGSFVWNSFPNPNVVLAPNQFSVFGQHGFNVDYSGQRGDGGGTRWLYIGDVFAGVTLLTWNGASLTNGGIWSNASDKNRKTDFAEVDRLTILQKVAALPLREWRYTNETIGVKHIGPTAQDFHAAFGLGTDDKTIGTVNADGVALAAIQGLNQKLEDQLKEHAPSSTPRKPCSAPSKLNWILCNRPWPNWNKPLPASQLLHRNAVSLAVGVDATSLNLGVNGSGSYGTDWTTQMESTQDHIVISDRNIHWDEANAPCGSGLTLIQTALRDGSAHWTNAIPGIHGTVGQVDGSVHQTPTVELRTYVLQGDDHGTVHFVVPP